MSIPYIKNRYNRKEWNDLVVVEDYGESKTVPGESLTIPEMLKRHSNGLTVPVDSRLKWIDGDLPPELNDLTDIDAARQMLAEFEEKINEEKEYVNQREQEIIEKSEEPPKVSE